jgi:myo-inositol-1(or 4)-monophosphatase
MPASPPVLDADWLGACRRATAELSAMLAAAPTTRERAVEVGQGEGGDTTLVIDRDAEVAVFDQLDALHAAGAAFTAVSEERGEVAYGGGDVSVIIDPIDGSLNAKRGLPHHALSIAVADGPTMADVVFGYVYDFGPGEEWIAHRGEGAFLDGVRIDPTLEERRSRAGKLEVLALESADPRWIAQAVEPLERRAHRVRALGSIAVSMCQLAATRVDAFATIKRCRAIDVAAAQLIAREGGAHVAFTGCDDPLGAPLDLAPHFPVVGARSAQGLDEVSEIPAV